MGKRKSSKGVDKDSAKKVPQTTSAETIQMGESENAIYRFLTGKNGLALSLSVILLLIWLAVLSYLAFA